MLRSIEEIQKDLDVLKQSAKDPSYWDDDPGAAYNRYVFAHSALLRELQQTQLLPI